MSLTEGFYWNFNAKTREWSRRFYEKQKRMPTLIHAGTYSAVMTYLRAVQEAQTDSAVDVMKQLKQTRINDVFATNGRIRADGRMVHDTYLVNVKKPGDSKEPWDYYDVKAVIPADDSFQPLTESRCSLLKGT